MNAKQSILLVDDDVVVISTLRRVLAGVCQLRFATSGHDALQMARQQPPDLILMDVEMPDMNGIALCAAMKADPILVDIPIIFVTSHSGTDQEVAGLNAGAVDFISKPPSPPIVIARVRTHLRLKEMSDSLRRIALIDGLTGIANRRRFDEALTAEWASAVRNKSSVALLLADVDHFKAYNDHYGHPAGDDCLREIAELIRNGLSRPDDIVARYGGEEFAVILPNTALDGAKQVAQRILSSVAARRLPHAASNVAQIVTLSMGLSIYDASVAASCNSEHGKPGPPESLAFSPAALIAAADRALYAAKQAGRRQINYLPVGFQQCGAQPEFIWRIEIGQSNGEAESPLARLAAHG